MFRIVLLSVVFAAAGALFAQQPEQTQAQVAAAQASTDQTAEMVASDLRTLARVTSVAKDLPDARQILLAIIDGDIETLRVARPDGTYQWASLQREEGGRVTDEKAIEHVHTEKELRNVSVTGSNAFRVVVTVPPKRGVFSGNNRVWVRNVLVDSTGFDGKITHREIPVNAWVNPGDSNTVALPEIGKSVKVTAELGVESGSKKSVAEVALIEAKLVDDPAGPWYPAVKRFLQIRQFAAEKEMNRGHLKSAIDEGLLSLPGEMEKRVAAQDAAEDERKRLALAGEVKGAIALGDATPDVVKELSEVGRLLTGTLQEQADGRARLETLIGTLAPKPTEPATPK